MSKEIINEAFSWIGTKFKHQGRVKKSQFDLGGCDCLVLVMGIAKNLSIKALNDQYLIDFDKNSYPKLITSNILYQEFKALLKESNKIFPGDLLILEINKWPQHLAIVVKVEPDIVIIHSYVQARKVVLQYLPKNWRIFAAFNF